MSLRHSAKDKTTNQTHDKTSSASRRPTFDLRYVTSLGCLGLLGSGAVFAQVGVDPQEMPQPSGEPIISVPAPAPAPDLSGVPADVVFDAPATPIEPAYTEPATPLPSVLEDLPAPVTSYPDQTGGQAGSQTGSQTGSYSDDNPGTDPGANHSYIDETDYSLGATELYSDRDTTVVLEERNSGCASSLAPGQALTNGLCANAVFGNSGSTNPNETGGTRYPSGVGRGAVNGGGNPTTVSSGSAPSWSGASASYATGAMVYPVNLSDRNSSFDPYSAAGLSYAQLEAQVTRNLATMPFGRIGNGDRSLLFPVSVPSPISSFFGFRIHPIAQTQRLHTGTDIAAPYGTPVLAAFSGKVTEASDLGGYGLTVVLSHNEGTSETLYAHMSELLVNVGDDVKQGDPLGRVGSTGFSTGPHLHFEVKQMTDMGWVYLDANRQLEVALERLIDSSQLAQLPRADRGSL